MGPEMTLGLITRRCFGSPGMLPERLRGAGSILHRFAPMLVRLVDLKLAPIQSNHGAYKTNT